MEEAKAEMENKVSKILKLIQNKDGISKASKKKPELLVLVQDLHKHFQSLYSLYDHLKEESEKKTIGRKENLNAFSSASSSDSEYYSSEEIDSNNSNLKLASSLELETANLEVAGLKRKLASTTEEREALNSEYMAVLSKLQEAEIINKHMSTAADEKEKELSTLVKLNEVRDNQASARIKELEGQLTGLYIELQAQYDQKRDLEARIESKATEVKQLGEKNKGLHSRMLELELISKEKGNEISKLLKKLRENENNSTSRIEDLLTLVGDMQEEVDFLRAQKGELEGSMLGKENEELDQFKGLIDQVNTMQHELASLRNQRNEMELLLDMKTKENSQNLIQVKDLKEELERKTMIEQIMLEEKEGFVVQVKDLELEVVSLGKHKKELEEQIRSKILESSQLREEKEGLHSRIIESERLFTERGDEILTLHRINEVKESEASNQLMALKVQADHLQQELDSLQTQKSELTNKIADQKRILKEQEDVINKLTEEHKLIKHLSLGPKDSKLNLHVLERKMEELAEDFRMKMEDHIRLLYQRIYVAEQIHTENKNNCRRIKETLEQETRALGETIATYEAQFRKMRDVLQSGYNAFTELDLAVRKLEDSGNFLNLISKMSNDIQFAKTWVTEKNNEINKLTYEMDSLVAQLESKEAQEFSLREKVWKLEEKLSKKGGDKLNLMKAVNKLEMKVVGLEKQIKEKDEELLGLGEEKREAIRQLCVSIDYHSSRSNHLKRLISKMTIRSVTRT